MGIGMPSHYSSSVNSNRSWRKYLRSDQSVFFFLYQICFQLTCTNTYMQNMHAHFAEVGFLGCPLALSSALTMTQVFTVCASPGVQVKDIPPSAKTVCHKKKKSDQWSRCTLERLPRKWDELRHYNNFTAPHPRSQRLHPHYSGAVNLDDTGYSGSTKAALLHSGLFPSLHHWGDTHPTLYWMYLT